MEIIVGAVFTVLIIIVIILILGFVLYASVKNSLGNLFHSLFGNKSLKQVVNEGNWVDENVPKSISSATSIYLPKIQADFPGFSWDDFRQKSQNAVKSTLLAMSTHDLNLLSSFANKDLRDQVRLSINDDDFGGCRTYYDDITVHNAEIFSYSKQNGLCTITVNTAVGYRKWQEKDNSVIMGSKQKTAQTRYHIELIYVQNSELADASYDTGKGLTCPNCGAPIKNLAQKQCAYCGTGVIEYNDKVWRFGRLTES